MPDIDTDLADVAGLKMSNETWDSSWDHPVNAVALVTHDLLVMVGCTQIQNCAAIHELGVDSVAKGE